MLAKCRVLIAVLVTLPALLVSLHAYAQGLGQISLNSAINEPLDARIEIQQLGGLDESQILVSLASEADFERFNIERLPFLQGIQFDVQVNSNNSATIILSTTNPVVEPYISLVLDARWPNGRLIREYTVLLDLPTFTAAPTAPAPQPAVTNPEPEPPVEPASGTASSPAVREPLIPPDNTPEQADPQVSEQQPGQFPESPAGPEEIVPETEPQTAQAADIAEQEAVAEQSSVPDPLPAPEPEVEVQEQTVLTQSNDTLWQIALETRPDEVSV
ncbi:MAG: hypothetical protein WD601_03830, partial [Pseudohongiellaceae bacterium]